VPRARKSLGQNFLVDPNIQKKIAAAVEPAADVDVLEIGPGRLIAVELDRQLAADLARSFEGQPHVSILHQNILDTRIDALVEDTAALHVVGNIPYYITTPILFHLLRREWRPAHIVLMVQREVAERITATHGASYGALSVAVLAVAHVDRLFHVGRNAFRPVPNVDSTVIRITPIRPFPLTQQEEADLRALTQAAFGWRRKQLQRTLRSNPAYALLPPDIQRLHDRTGIDLELRPESLAPADLIRLARVLRSDGWPREKP
jgi:16S rRNA (adenine1518-N6/adenine1519-N6)-dimethyltransferase